MGGLAPARSSAARNPPSLPCSTPWNHIQLCSDPRRAYLSVTTTCLPRRDLKANNKNGTHPREEIPHAAPSAHPGLAQRRGQRPARHPPRYPRSPRTRFRRKPHLGPGRAIAQRLGLRGAHRHRQDRRGRRAAQRQQPTQARPACRHGRAAHSRGHRRCLQQPPPRLHARLRP
ncbi:hypothetical protein D3C80_1619590 [compost metagenome]